MAAQAPRREPTNRELAEAIAKVAESVTAVNELAVKQARRFRDTLTEHRAEVRKGFAETATRAEVAALRDDVAGLRNDVVTMRAEIMAQFEKLQAKPSEN